MRGHHVLARMARAVSILGHPLLLTPIAGTAAWFAGGGAGTEARGIASAALLAAALVMGYSYQRVRSGAWSHVDASEPGERRNLNRILLAMFAAAAFAGVLLGWPLPVSLGLWLGAAMVAAALLAARWCKPSLHVAFAVFSAALLLAVSPLAAAAGLLLTLVIAWSRWYLRRHVAADLWCGTIIGAAAGAALWAGLQRWPA